MLRRMDDVGRHLRTEDLDDIERALGKQLPEEYRRFLMRHNGGTPVPSEFGIHGLEGNPYGNMQEFFGIDQALESSDLLWIAREVEDRVHRDFLAIGSTDCGDLICLKTGGDSIGSVWFWDSKSESPKPSLKDLYPIAGGFNDFLGSLKGPESTDPGTRGVAS